MNLVKETLVEAYQQDKKNFYGMVSCGAGFVLMILTITALMFLY
jgi:hypothetical protein